jgi:hypothetical protein
LIAVEPSQEAVMNQRMVKSALGVLLVSGALAGCATSVDWGGPLLHYRYNYDSRPVVSEEPVVVPAPAVAYRDPPVVYRESTVTQYLDTGVTSRAYREPVLTYRQPTVIYGYQSPSVPYQEHGQ